MRERYLSSGKEAKRAAPAAQPGESADQRGGRDLLEQPEAAAARDYQVAFAQAYQAYYRRLFAYMYNRVNQVEVAQDLTAQVFEQAYVKGHTLRDYQAYGAWLFTIARNVVSGYFRQHKRRRRYREQIERIFLEQPGPEDPAERILRAEAMSRLMAFVRLLSQREQELLALKFEGELTNEEIAGVMGMSPVNVRVTLFRALAKLRARLQELEGT